MMVQAMDLMRMTRTELDELFRSSPVGPIPRGRTRGTAIFAPGTVWERPFAAVTRALAWKGKVFSPKSSDLRNLISPFNIPAIRARVYRGDSWFAPGEAIILDYSQTSLVARKIRDEIRQVAPGVYLGQVYWGRRRILNFMLETTAEPAEPGLLTDGEA